MAASSTQVVRTKAQAMFGKLLTIEDRQRMLACRSVSDVVRYLKTETHFRTALADVEDAHRGYLESLLRRQNLVDMVSLLRYDRLLRFGWSDYIIGRWEQRQLLHALELMAQDCAAHFLAGLPLELNDVSHIDWLRVAQAKTLPELARAASRSAYGTALSRIAATSDTTTFIRAARALSETEAALQKTAVMRTRGGERRALIDFLDRITAAENVSRIYRLRHYFHLSDDRIAERLVKPLTPGQERPLLAIPEEDLWDRFFADAGKRIPVEQRQHTADLPTRVAYFEAVHAMHYSPYPSVVLLSYLRIVEAELDDIINITEGIRYGVPKEEIQSLLFKVGR